MDLIQCNKLRFPETNKQFSDTSKLGVQHESVTIYSSSIRCHNKGHPHPSIQLLVTNLSYSLCFWLTVGQKFPGPPAQVPLICWNISHYPRNLFIRWIWTYDRGSVLQGLSWKTCMDQGIGKACPLQAYHSLQISMSIPTHKLSEVLSLLHSMTD